MERRWVQSETFGLLPEPTALATLGLLLAAHARHLAWLSMLPVLSLAIGAATWWLVDR